MAQAHASVLGAIQQLHLVRDGFTAASPFCPAAVIQDYRAMQGLRFYPGEKFKELCLNSLEDFIS